MLLGKYIYTLAVVLQAAQGLSVGFIGWL